MLEVINITKKYIAGGEHLTAVDNVSFRAAKSDMVSIIGHSGCGKTTLLSLIGGLTRPGQGQVLIDNKDIWSMSDAGRSGIRNSKTGFIFQFPSLVPTLTAIENVMLPAAFGSFGKEIPDRALELLSLVGLEGRRGAYPSQLSGGQQRRVAIARAFITAPDAVLADEPTGDLDEATEAEMTDLFVRMNEMHGTTIIIVTHDRDIAARARRRFSMTKGRLIEL